MPIDAESQKIELTLQSTSLAVRAALKNVVKQLHDFGLSDANGSVTELVLAEVLNNIAEHAYQSCQPGNIELTIHKNDNSLNLYLVDQGQPLPENAIPTPTRADLSGEQQDLPEGGWGWLIILDLAEDVSYQRLNDKNYLNFKLSPNRAFEHQ